MNESVQPLSRGELLRREVMQTPEEVAAMLRLKALGWGVRRIAGELGCSHMTVRRYVAAGGWVAYRGRGRPRTLAGHEAGWRSVFGGMPATPMLSGRNSKPRKASD